MARTTIDFGIDLGTTNSSIAVLNGMEVKVFRNNEGMEYTPSAVWIDRSNRLYVGRLAKQHLDDDPDNTRCEFKLQMGTDTECEFVQTGRKMLPEELSAEVLKSLRADVQRDIGEEVQAAVITVPAAFELPQCEATKRAAELAGLVHRPLVQEPVAAALAYGFQSESDKVFWLMYDFGGGTFDAAVIQVRDGVIQVVNHGGDNMLGGKLIDWAIVEDLLIPALTRGRRLADFRRGNPKWRKPIAKLKLQAEEGKIRVSREEVAPIAIDFLCQDDRGEPVEFDYELRRADVERLAEPLILRSINLCKKVLADKRLEPADIEKMVLVGGPTMMPYLRERLADRHQGLGIPLEFRVDPLTVVARGAAIFAGTQRYEGGLPVELAVGQYAIELDYKPVGSETDPLVGGRAVGSQGEDLSGFTIEFVNGEARPPWRSGRITLGADGRFLVNLVAEKGRLNTFLIELCNAAGTRREAVPDRLTYTVGLSITDPPLIHSVGIALADNSVDVLFEKGTPLPARKRSLRRTAYDACRGRAEASIRIPIVEGGNRRADRNSPIGFLEIPAAQLKRDVPAGSDVEIAIEIDASRIVRAKAYVPLLDEEFEHVIDYREYRNKAKDAEHLRRDADLERKRLERAREKAAGAGDPAAQRALQRIDGERIEHDVETLLVASQADPDAAQKCEKRLLDLKLAVDDLEDALEWPTLVADAEETLRGTQEVVQQHGSAADRRNEAALERETHQAIQSRDAEILQRKISELAGLRYRVWAQQPSFWVALLQHLEQQRGTMRDRSQAEQLFARGHRAMDSGDVPGLKAAVQQLIALLPAGEQEKLRKGHGSTVV